MTEDGLWVATAAPGRCTKWAGWAVQRSVTRPPRTAVTIGWWRITIEARDFTATAPKQCWVGDLSVVGTCQGWLYLAVIMDWYWRVNEHKGQPASSHAGIDNSLMRRELGAQRLHHSGKGLQYASYDFRPNGSMNTGSCAR
ncbi:MAG: hypothetical protein GKR94_06115 [Gammaproteobacteria bacterium]|nr:hypothetical protein [Gammaproteobacteria bacterium]